MPLKAKKARLKATIITLVIMSLAAIVLTLLKIFSPDLFSICEGGLALIGCADLGLTIYKFCKEW